MLCLGPKFWVLAMLGRLVRIALDKLGLGFGDGAKLAVTTGVDDGRVSIQVN